MRYPRRRTNNRTPPHLAKFYREFRRDVLKRDKGKCQFPGCRKKARYVHHIVRWADNPALRFNVNNACGLCKGHHDKVTGYEHLYQSVLMKIVLEHVKKQT
jgi:5-methylcytosine-specific restriction endonuclease McrA